MCVAIVVAALVLALPTPPPEPPSGIEATAFRWDSDALFSELEDEFERAGALEPGAVREEFDALVAEAGILLDSVASAPELPEGPLDRLSTLQFRIAVLAAARSDLLPGAERLMVRVRRDVMSAASSWPSGRATHEALYRVVVGARIALDEALAQAGPDALSPLRVFPPVESSTPWIEVEGVRVHSGDILLSRGGAPTSALIARGNDFPSTFSHAALAHVDAETGVGTVVESLIETGSILTTVEEYLESRKHRILVLRLRPDHPAVVADPLLPHRAAQAMLDRLRTEHIPYDFAMEWDDPAAAFCSEIVYQPYREAGVDLWSIRSSMTSPGLVRWLAMMGVREFTSLVPSDAELDPQLAAVAEWRDAEALLDYRLDNAIIDALLEEAERGAGLGFPWYALPLARVAKGYSIAQSAVGRTPTIPAGMNASTALRVNALVSTVHPRIRAALEPRVERYVHERGFQPPYWALVQLARESLEAVRDELPPALAR